MRCMAGARRKVNIERSIGSKCLLCLNPINCLVGHVDRKMIFRVMGRFYPCDAIVNGGRPLVGFTTNKTIELIETGMGRPAIIGT